MWERENAKLQREKEELEAAHVRARAHGGSVNRGRSLARMGGA